MPALRQLADEICLETIHHRAQLNHPPGDREETCVTRRLGVAARAFRLHRCEDVTERATRERRNLRDNRRECRLVLGKLRKGCELCVKIGGCCAKGSEVLVSPRREIAAIGRFHVQHLPLNKAGRGLEVPRLAQVHERIHHLHPDLQHRDDRKHEHQQADDQRNHERAGQIEHPGSGERRGTGDIHSGNTKLLDAELKPSGQRRDIVCVPFVTSGPGTAGASQKKLVQVVELTGRFHVSHPASPSHKPRALVAPKQPGLFYAATRLAFSPKNSAWLEIAATSDGWNGLVMR